MFTAIPRTGSRQSIVNERNGPVDTFSRRADKVLNTNGLVDLVEEIRLRTWARTNYTAPHNRHATWHPIVHEEMERRDCELDMTVV